MFSDKFIGNNLITGTSTIGLEGFFSSPEIITFSPESCLIKVKAFVAF